MNYKDIFEFARFSWFGRFRGGIFLYLIAFILLVSCKQEKKVYLFSTFREPADKGLFLAYSYDGYHWNDLGGPWLKPEVGKQKVMRDPSIVSGPGGTFHMVWTSSWQGDLGFGYASSKDLVHWSEEQFIPVMEFDTSTVNVWAPELFYDDGNEHYIIVWASTVPFKFEKGIEDERNNHRLYYTTTKDFKKFSETKLYYDPGFSVIDATIVKREKDDYVLVLKDNTRPERNIKVAFGKTALGPWKNVSTPFTKQFTEGPTVLKLKNKWLIYFDAYRDKKYGAVETSDFNTFTDISDKISLPEGHKHGTVFTVNEELLKSLLLKAKRTSSFPGEEYLSFTEDGAWCWFSDPRAVYFEGTHKRTYSGWMDSKGNVVVGYYDHVEKGIKSEIIRHNFQVDDHDNPTIFIDKEGFLFVFYSKHANREPMYMLKSSRPESITHWEPVQPLALNDSLTYRGYSNTYTYVNIQQLANEQNRLYLFWRGADFKPNFSLSDDNGKSWTTGKIMVLPERIYRDRRPYMKISSNHQNTIHFAFTDGHPGNEPTNSIYYTKYKEGTLFKANGEEIMKWQDLPLNPADADIVYDATKTNEKAWIWDVAEDENSNPVMVYSRFPNDTIHLYYYAIWSDNRWNNYKLVDSGTWFPENTEKPQREPNYSGGLVLDHKDPSVVYLSRQKAGVFEIERWQTSDRGKTWKIEEITSLSAQNNVRPFVIRNYNEQDSLRVLWMNVRRYMHYTDYDAAIKMNLAR